MTGLVDLEAAGVVAAGVPLAPLTTYKLGGPARWFVEVADESVLTELAAALAAEPGRPEILVLGRGSNIVVADAGFDGVVVRLGSGFQDLRVDDDGTVTAGGAVPQPRLARESVRHGRGGLEWFVGIPGSVGGAVRMNAGCHGSDTAEWLVTARTVDLGDGTLAERGPAELGLSYRHSGLTGTEVVTGAVFRTVPRDPAEGERVLREVTRWRRLHQPGGSLNAGSVFKNPPGDAAGRIIDALGLKGLRHGDVSVSTRHANFFVAGPGATARDVHELVMEVRRRVEEGAGVRLEPEICFVGFDDGGSGVGDPPGRSVVA
jgi:UDP-N-acetylmuramate dehydrogenase